VRASSSDSSHLGGDVGGQPVKDADRKLCSLHPPTWVFLPEKRPLSSQCDAKNSLSRV